MKTAAEHLLELIRIPSPSSISNRPVVDYAAACLRQAGWGTLSTTHLDPTGVEKVNLIAAPPGQDPQQPAVDLAFLCHTDTVPYAADWPEATVPFIADDLLYGCGSCDVKGFLACLLTAVEECESSPLRPDLRIVLTADEEIGCLGAQRLLASGLLQPRRLVIGEPTSLHPARAGKGYCLAEITVLGAEAHSAHPKQGRSAIFGAARLIREIELLADRLSQHRNEFFDPAYTTINVGTIHGGTAKNIIPARCSFLVEWRPIPSEDVSSVPNAIKAIVQQIQQDDPSFRVDIKVLRQQSGFETPQESSLVRAVEFLTAKASVAIPFGSEANLFASVAREIIVFGPGDMRTAHSPRECVPLAELHEAVRCIRSLMQTSRIS